MLMISRQGRGRMFLRRDLAGYSSTPLQFQIKKRQYDRNVVTSSFTIAMLPLIAPKARCCSIRIQRSQQTHFPRPSFAHQSLLDMLLLPALPNLLLIQLVLLLIQPVNAVRLLKPPTLCAPCTLLPPLLLLPPFRNFILPSAIDWMMLMMPNVQLPIARKSARPGDGPEDA